VHLTKSGALTALLHDIPDHTAVVTPENLPAFNRSIDDGIASVRAWRWSDRRAAPSR
jgi:hypothetical protein